MKVPFFVVYCFWAAGLMYLVCNCIFVKTKCKSVFYEKNIKRFIELHYFHTVNFEIFYQSSKSVKIISSIFQKDKYLTYFLCFFYNLQNSRYYYFNKTKTRIYKYSTGKMSKNFCFQIKKK